MTIHNLAFFFEENDKDIYSGRKIDLDAYLYSAKAFGVKQIAVINNSKLDVNVVDESISLKIFSSFEEFRKQHENEILLLSEVPWAAPANSYFLGKELPNFDWLVIGPSTGWLPQPENVQWLTIPQNGKGALHSQHITTLILGFLFLKR